MHTGRMPCEDKGSYHVMQTNPRNAKDGQNTARSLERITELISPLWPSEVNNSSETLVCLHPPKPCNNKLRLFEPLRGNDVFIATPANECRVYLKVFMFCFRQF